MKSCAYCGCENTDDAVHCRECATTEFNIEVATTPEPEEMPESYGAEENAFDQGIELSFADARVFLEGLEAAGVPFELVPLDAKMGEMDAGVASVGGSFGRAVSLRILTRLADHEKVQRVWRGFCGFQD